MLKSVTRLIALLVIAIPFHSANALPYLSGVQIYASGSDGSNTGAYSGTPYQFSTNTAISSGDLSINGIPLGTTPLHVGDNLFSFNPSSSGYPIDIVGLNLFFNLSGDLFTPVFQPGVGLPGDLAAYTEAGSATFGTPIAGTNVQSFNTSGTTVNTTSYSGSSSFLIGNWSLSIADFYSTTTPSGTFTIRVTEVPEPATLMFMLLGLAGLTYLNRQNLRKTQSTL